MSLIQNWNFCPRCGGKLAEANDGERNVPHCPECRRFYYNNPVPCVTTVLETEAGILLILRGKEPKSGWWALPGGFLDIGESPEEGARREFHEETGLEALETSLIGLVSQHSDRFGSVIYAGYEILRYGGELAPGSDAVEARFFPRDRLPDIAFGSLEEILRLHFRNKPEPPSVSQGP
ncbi:MAG: NUDIX hydrolase [Planctomycetota bacterium]|jgi:ADP-ribose pyrophosphatase YjhB (NUDIX family)